MRKTSDYLGQPALICTRRLCPFCAQEWLLRSKLGRTLLAVLAVLALVGVATLLGACDPYEPLSDPKPLQSGVQLPDGCVWEPRPSASPNSEFYVLLCPMNN